MNPTITLVVVLVVIAAILFGAWLALRISARTVVTSAEQEAAQALEKGLAFLLDDSADDKAIAAAQKRKTSRAALRTQVLHEIAAAISSSGPAPAAPVDGTVRP
jgi:hypothetical protein